MAQLVRGALRFRIEGPDRFQRVAEEIKPDRGVDAGREQIDDAAAHGVIAGLAHRGCAGKAIELEPLHDAGHGLKISGGGRERLPGERVARRQALQDGVDGSQQHRRPVAAFDVREARQRLHALRHHRGMRRGAVVGQAIPGGKFQHFDVGGKEAERAREHRHARPVAADHGEADGRWRFPGRNGAGEIGEHQPLGAVGDAGEKQRPARRKPLRRRPRGGTQGRGHGFASGLGLPVRA